MKISVKNDKENPYLKRNELNVFIEHEGGATPQKAALQKVLAQELGKDLKHIEIKNIFSLYGKGASKATVYVWHKKEVPDLEKEKAAKDDEEKKQEPKQEAKKEIKK